MKTLIRRTLVTLCGSGLIMSAATQTALGQPDTGPGPGDVPPPDEGAINEQPATNQSVAPTTGVQPPRRQERRRRRPSHRGAGSTLAPTVARILTN